MRRGDGELQARIAVLAPTGRDCELIVAMLATHGLSGCQAPSVEALVAELEGGVGAAIITEEALSRDGIEHLEKALARQPPWSDFPFVVLSSPRVEGERPAVALQALGNVTMLDRPVRTRTLLSAVHAALRARQRQYEGRRAIEQRDRFLAMLGHELRNPLGAIRLASEKLVRKDADHARHVEMVHRQTQQLSRLVDDLLDVTRITAGKISLSLRTLDLRELARRCVATVEPWSAARHTRLRLTGGPEPAWVDGDVVRLEQVLSNLLVNALKYTPEGGAVEVTVRTDETRCTLSVRDTGIGIALGALEPIFELFEQVDDTLDRSQGGLGLGLTLVRSLVGMHGGTVVAKSEGLGKGSEFVVQLPRALRAPAPSAPRVAPQPQGSPLKVVVVEDNRDIREMLEELLLDGGHRVAAAAEGSSGLSLIVRELPDLALVDIGLPGLDGYQVAEQVRRQVGKRVRMVALSGYGRPEDKARALRAGFDAHLTKPIDLDSLYAAMR